MATILCSVYVFNFQAQLIMRYLKQYQDKFLFDASERAHAGKRRASSALPVKIHQFACNDLCLRVTVVAVV